MYAAHFTTPDIVLPPAFRRNREDTVSQVSVCSRGGGGKGGNRFRRGGGYRLPQVLMGGSPSADREYPGQVRMGNLLPGQNWMEVPPPPELDGGTPSPQGSNSRVILDTQRAVCLSRSRRRTFLFL